MEVTVSVTFLVLFSILLCESYHHGVETGTVVQTLERTFPEKAASVNVDLAGLIQKLHLQELFRRYGENNSLTIEGFRKLLQNIGIDKMKRVKVDHDHDHDHHLHHNHVSPSKNSEKTVCPNHESDAGKDSRNSHSKEPHKAENADHQQNLVRSKNAVNEIVASINTTPTDGNPELQSLDPGEGKSVARLGLTSSNAINITDGSNTSWLANSKANESLASPKESERGSYLYSKLKNQNTQECSSASKLMQSHGIGTQALLTATEFSYLCPALINQIDGKCCIVHASSEKTETPPKGYSLQIAWIGGFISISVISFLSLLGVILVPLMNRVFFKFLLSFLVALAVGTLSGDAFLHLLPHSHGNHHHHHEKPPLEQNKDPLFKHLVFQSTEESAYLDSTWKGLTALGGLYFMFLVEHLITLIKQFKDKKKKKKNEDDGESKKFSANEEKLDTDDRSEGYLGTDSQDPSPFISQQPAVQEEEEVMIAHSHQEEVDNEYVSRGCRNKCHSHLHDTLGQTDHLSHHHHDYHHILHHHHHQNHHPHSHSQRYSREELKDAGIATLAWMVIMGDGLHNFSDGLAIGAAFTEGLSSGLSTSVAVFCHELPHELGDFAVLLKAGMTVKQAVLYNALSAMLAYLGMATGILIGHYADNVSMWIFALTAGLFMYVALVDMVPEMLHNDASDHGCSRWGYFLLQNAGILLGFGIMLLISVFEHKIVFSINL
ncbi:zinc transporter ZIP6 isoform X1 [Anas platyrhynchos]|uniref:Zinc transporter ZIP6 n=2 Tax=Anas platyrhynchos TaxID=8839 RepID=U3IP40_ANAPP|nr:zinc transporter ZIP6 isoform X1 [Anas platyrhynchos]XP_021133403.1 zinc transporter ZIP6 isoform X1 [Anas platyrhynchos]|eukprot:XP_005010667.1 zinc transporter ZIP6 isoform X1 [Anas platyrhynchos]